jgi:hypothetical protein
MSSALNIVARWHIALNTGQVDQMVELVHPEVEVGGPRGKTQGAAVVKEWFGRANIRLIPLRYFNRQNVVVVEEQGEWLSPETGQVTGSQVVASVFAVTEGLITGILRYDNLATALREGGLAWSDESQPG